MSDTSREKLVETLRKAVSRTSMMAEGIDPQLDKTLLQIRHQIAGGADEESVRQALKEVEPNLIAADEARADRAKMLRDVFQDLVALLERLPNHQIPQNQKNVFETNVRSHWQTLYKWPDLVKEFLTLAEATLESKISDTPKRSLLGRLFSRADSKPKLNETEIVTEISQSLLNLVNNLSMPEAYDEQISDLKQVLQQDSEINHLPKVLAEAINLTLIALGKTQQDLTSYLSKLNKQLASINASVVSSYKNQKSLSNQREDFNSELQRQVNEANDAVQGATDLNALQAAIAGRLDNISKTMVQYRKQMAEQEKQASQSISQLKVKVNRMEKDASALRLNLQQKLAQAMTDSLTNLPNRAAYQDTILPLCRASQKVGTPLVLGVCDIDHFKSVNDNWGHLAGDKVLRLVPRQIRDVLTEKDMVFRYGGEEFVILFPGNNLDIASKKAEAIRKAVERMPFNVNGEPVPITISIGLALLQTEEDHENLFARADKCLYQAKEMGRNQVVQDDE